jgi:hypothetical protein
MSGHTREPWLIKPFDESQMVIVSGGFGEKIQPLIAIVLAGSNGEGAANARLIAASPALLEDLKGWYDHARYSELGITQASDAFNRCLARTRSLIADIENEGG